MKWIKLSDELPPGNVFVLIWWSRGTLTEDGKSIPGVSIGSYRSRVNEVRPIGCNYDARDEISHWMHMPEKPEENE